MSYPNLNEDPTPWKRTTKDDEIRTLICETEKHDYEMFFKSFKIDNDYYKQEQENINKQKV